MGKQEVGVARIPGSLRSRSGASAANLMHIALVVQNAEIEADIRPRAEAEALAGAGFRVTLVGGTRDEDRARDVVGNGVVLNPYPMPRAGAGVAGQAREASSSFGRLAGKLVAIARSSAIDVLHASNPPDNVWLLTTVLRSVQRTAPRFVFDQHDVAPVLLEEKFGTGAAIRALTTTARALERRSFSRASLVVFANAEYERRARSEGLLSGPAAVVPNGWSLPDAEPTAAWHQGRKHLIAYVGAINEQDYVAHLVETIALLPSPEDVLVCVAGEGAARRNAEERAAALGISDAFQWLGWVQRREEIASLVRSADVCVAPEVDSPFNRLASFVKIAEYMSVGAPVVAHRLAQNERLGGDTIHYAAEMTPSALADALVDMLQDRTRAHRLGRAARARFVDQIAWESVGAPNLLRAYADTFGSERR